MFKLLHMKLVVLLCPSCTLPCFHQSKTHRKEALCACTTYLQKKTTNPRPFRLRTQVCHKSPEFLDGLTTTQMAKHCSLSLLSPSESQRKVTYNENMLWYRKEELSKNLSSTRRWRSTLQPERVFTLLFKALQYLEPGYTSQNIFFSSMLLQLK